MKYIVYVCRVLVGSLFIVSGLIKVNDALGFVYKLQEYAEPGAFNAPILEDWGLGIAMFVSIAEILLGVALLIGALPKLTTILSMVMMVFFTVLTGYTCNCDPNGTKEITEVNAQGVEEVVTIPNQCVLECGCFGNAIPLKACESFLKDIVLDVLLLPIFIWAMLGRISLNTKEEDIYLFAASLAVLMWFCLSMLDWPFPVLFTALTLIVVTAIKRRSSAPHKEWIMAGAVLVLSAGVQWYTLNHLPLKDYRPYAEGNYLPIQMQDVSELTQDYHNMVEARRQQALELWAERLDAVEPNLGPALLAKARQIWSTNGTAPADSINNIEAIAYRLGLRAPVVATKYTFRNIHTGQDTVMLSTDWLKAYNQPWFKNNYEATDYSYDGDEVTIAEGVKTNIQDFAPESYEGDALLEEILEAEYIFLQISKDLEEAATSNQQAFNALAKNAEANGVQFMALTNAEYDDAEDFRHEHQAAYPFAVADQIEMKIIIRSNPGLVLLHKGTVLKKWAWRDVPEWDEVKGTLIP